MGWNIPGILRQRYNIPAGSKCSSSKTIQAAIEFTGMGAPPISDLQEFAQQAEETFVIFSYIYGPYSPEGGDESNLDTEYLMAIG